MLKGIARPACVYLLATHSLFTAYTSRLFASDEVGELSHEALFAPNKTFPYFESLGKFDDNTPQTFSANNAALLAQCSLLIYVREPEYIRDTLNKAGFTQIQFFDKSGTYAFLAENDEHIVITFRGTETGDKTDYLTDSKFHQAAFTEFGTAHSGFIEALLAIQDDLQSSLAQSLEGSPNKTVWVTGHSLGAALATLFCIQNSDSVDALYAIGSPRAVGQKLAEHWQSKLTIFRVVNNNDLVTRVPGQPFYQHIGSTYFLTADQKLIIDPPYSQAWKERLRGHKKFIRRLFKEHWLENDFSAIPSDYFVDHSPRLYAEILIGLAHSQVQE